MGTLPLCHPSQLSDISAEISSASRGFTHNDQGTKVSNPGCSWQQAATQSSAPLKKITNKHVTTARAQTRYGPISSMGTGGTFLQTPPPPLLLGLNASRCMNAISGCSILGHPDIQLQRTHWWYIAQQPIGRANCSALMMVFLMWTSDGAWAWDCCLLVRWSPNILVVVMVLAPNKQSPHGTYSVDVVTCMESTFMHKQVSTSSRVSLQCDRGQSSGKFYCLRQGTSKRDTIGR